MFCPFIRNECYKDCVFNYEQKCEITELLQLYNIEYVLNELNESVQKLNDILVEKARWE